MITPSFSLTATERVLPKLALDFTTASLDPRVTFTRSGNTATYVASTGYVTAINADLPRFDYNPVTLACKGLLIEESRINIATYSNTFSNAAWIKSRSSIGATPIVSPDGTSNAYKLTEDSTAANSHFMEGTAAITSGTTYTWSIFAKQGGRTQIRVRAFMTSSSSADFDLVTGTISNASGTTGTSIDNMGNGWYRCSISALSSTTGTGYLDCFLMSGGSVTYNGDGTSGAYIYGAQFEAGAFVTSYIPNAATGSTTRNADVATMTGTNFSSWYNQTEGAFEVQCQTMSFASARGIYAAGDPTKAFGAAENIYANYFATTGTIVDNVLTGGVAVVGIVPTKTQAINTPTKNVFAYKLNSFAGSTGASTVETDNAGALPTPTGLSLGGLSQGWSGATTYLNGYLQQFYYWPQRLTNAEVQAFSK